MPAESSWSNAVAISYGIIESVLMIAARAAVLLSPAAGDHALPAQSASPLKYLLAILVDLFPKFHDWHSCPALYILSHS